MIVIELFHLVWVLLFWSLPVILRFQMVEKAGNSSDKDAPHQSLPAVRTTVFLNAHKLTCHFHSVTYVPNVSLYVCRPFY